MRARRLLTAVLGSVLLCGCSTTVVGSAVRTPGVRAPVDVPPDEFPIVGAVDGNPVDRSARNSLVDLYSFWRDAYPETFGAEFQPLQGGVFSVDPDNVNPAEFPDGVGCGARPADVENNAFYCNAPGRPHSDSITYDRTFLGELADQFGEPLVPVVLAHEFGHAIQARSGFSGPSINQETQADCFAGAWTAWVAQGNAEHTAVRQSELDTVIRGYLRVADPPGTAPTQPQAHGSFFDRASALAEGYDGGVTACRDNFGAARVFTEREFSGNDVNEGNAPYDQTLQYVDQTLPPFWADVFPAAFGRDFEQPAITAFDGTAPRCVENNRDLGYCESEQAVYYDEQDLTRPAYQEIGDYAVATAISLPYGQAVRSQLGRSTDDDEATRSAVCLSGWYTAQLFRERLPGVQLSPGDVDEAVVFLLTYGVDDSVFPNTDLSGFELLRSFRAGFLQGAGPCDVGV